MFLCIFWWNIIQSDFSHQFSDPYEVSEVFSVTDWVKVSQVLLVFGRFLKGGGGSFWPKFKPTLANHLLQIIIVENGQILKIRTNFGYSQMI